jgi:hemerythrin-like domain-containing protein
MPGMSTRVDALLHAGPAVGFEQPFEMLAACHDRVRRSLDLLQRLQAHVEQHGADEQARSAAADVLRYFDIAGPAHHEDEERHVLPRLRAAGEAALADRLHADHEAMGEAWAQLRLALLALTEGRPAGLDAMACRAYAELYAGHMQAEEGRAFPIARQDLAAGTEAAMGAEMAGRRR